jgi:transcription elongation factor/antiterminator RfaH
MVMESPVLDQPVTTAACRDQPAIPADGERWFVVHTLPYQENRAQVQLENQRYRTFLPKRERTIRRARKLTTVVAPLFPRYMFIILDPEHDRWRPVNSTLGVAGMVVQGERPQPVPPGIVETLIASSGSDGLLKLRPQLNVGDRVRLTQGPFAEYLGTLDRLDDSGRVQALLDMLGRGVPILVEGHWGGWPDLRLPRPQGDGKIVRRQQRHAGAMSPSQNFIKDCRAFLA